MRKALAAAGVLVLLALAGLAGAGVHQLLSGDGVPPAQVDRVPAQTQQPGDRPLLTPEKAADLVRTYMSTAQELSRTCLLVFAPDDRSTALARDLTPSYVGGGLWIVSNELCTFALSDDTGKVTGP